MAILTGKVGKVKIDTNDLGEVDSVSLNIIIDISKITKLEDIWNKQRLFNKSWNSSCSLKYNPADTAQLILMNKFISGDCVLIEVYEDNINYLFGDGVLTSFDIAKNANAIDTLSVTIKGSGALREGAEYSYTASGSIILSGEAEYEPGYEFVASGSIILSGEGDTEYYPDYEYTASGSMVLSGEAECIGLYLLVAHGGEYFVDHDGNFIVIIEE